MDVRNLDARDITGPVFPLGLGAVTHQNPDRRAPAANLELMPAVVPPPPAPVAPDPELPTTIEQLRNIVRLECLKTLPTPDEFRALIQEGVKEILSKVPTGEA